jgi:hypothetical protein
MLVIFRTFSWSVLKRCTAFYLIDPFFSTPMTTIGHPDYQLGRLILVPGQHRVLRCSRTLWWRSRWRRRCWTAPWTSSSSWRSKHRYQQPTVNEVLRGGGPIPKSWKPKNWNDKFKHLGPKLWFFFHFSAKNLAFLTKNKDNLCKMLS